MLILKFPFLLIFFLYSEMLLQYLGDGKYI